MRAHLAFLTLAVSLSYACSSSRSSSSAAASGSDFPDAAADASGDAAPAQSFGGDAGHDAASASSCERTLTMGALTDVSNAACFVNEHVSSQTTTLRFPCTGGAATAVFGTHTFQGTVSGDSIALTDVEPFVFNGCDWQSTETIQGDLAKGTVTYAYTEKPVVSCSDLPCTASGQLAVSAGAVTVVN